MRRVGRGRRVGASETLGCFVSVFPDAFAHFRGGTMFQFEGFLGGHGEASTRDERVVGVDDETFVSGAEALVAGEGELGEHCFPVCVEEGAVRLYLDAQAGGVDGFVDPSCAGEFEGEQAIVGAAAEDMFVVGVNGAHATGARACFDADRSFEKRRGCVGSELVGGGGFDAFVREVGVVGGFFFEGGLRFDGGCIPVLGEVFELFGLLLEVVMGEGGFEALAEGVGFVEVVGDGAQA